MTMTMTMTDTERSYITDEAMESWLKDGLSMNYEAELIKIKKVLGDRLENECERTTTYLIQLKDYKGRKGWGIYNAYYGGGLGWGVEAWYEDTRLLKDTMKLWNKTLEKEAEKKQHSIEK